MLSELYVFIILWIYIVIFWLIVLVIDMYLINKEGIFGYDLVDFNRFILLMFVILFCILGGIKEERIRYIVYVYVKWKKK